MLCWAILPLLRAIVITTSIEHQLTITNGWSGYILKRGPTQGGLQFKLDLTYKQKDKDPQCRVHGLHLLLIISKNGYIRDVNCNDINRGIGNIGIKNYISYLGFGLDCSLFNDSDCVCSVEIEFPLSPSFIFGQAGIAECVHFSNISTTSIRSRIDKIVYKCGSLSNTKCGKYFKGRKGLIGNETFTKINFFDVQLVDFILSFLIQCYQHQSTFICLAKYTFCTNGSVRRFPCREMCEDWIWGCNRTLNLYSGMTGISNLCRLYNSKEQDKTCFIQDVNCGPPKELPNAAFKTFSNGRRKLAKYRCNPSYTLVGNDTVLCLPTGKWQTLPICVPKPVEYLKSTVISASFGFATLCFIITAVVRRKHIQVILYSKLEWRWLRRRLHNVNYNNKTVFILYQMVSEDVFTRLEEKLMKNKLKPCYLEYGQTPSESTRMIKESICTILILTPGHVDDPVTQSVCLEACNYGAHMVVVFQDTSLNEIKQEPIKEYIKKKAVYKLYYPSRLFWYEFDFALSAFSYCQKSNICPKSNKIQVHNERCQVHNESCPILS